MSGSLYANRRNGSSTQLNSNLFTLPELKEEQTLSQTSLQQGIGDSAKLSQAVAQQEQVKQNETKGLRRVNSGMFSWAGDSGVWPGQQVHTGAIAFMTPMTYIYILVWYITGALTNSTSKQTLAYFNRPPFISLTLMQHLMATIGGTFAIRVLKIRQYKRLPVSADNSGFYRLLAVYTVGFCMTNGSFGAVNASFVDTIKAGEPIATVLLTLLFMPGEKVSLVVFLSLLPIVAGVGISSLADSSFNLLGFAMAMTSNLCFSARSICAKLLRTTLGKQMDNANLFVHVNLYGALLLLPLAIYFEGSVLLTTLMSGGPAAMLFVMNGLFYYLNNQMNFLVLEKVDAVTHGLINCGRRVANIMFAIFWFGTAVTLYNGVGISLALLGAFCYMRAKQHAASQLAVQASAVSLSRSGSFSSYAASPMASPRSTGNFKNM